MGKLTLLQQNSLVNQRDSAKDDFFSLQFLFNQFSWDPLSCSTCFCQNCHFRVFFTSCSFKQGGMATIHESLGPSPAAKTLMMSAFYFSCFECSSVAHLLTGICRRKSRFGIAWCLICFMYIVLILWLNMFFIIIQYVRIYPHTRNLFGQLT